MTIAARVRMPASRMRRMFRLLGIVAVNCVVGFVALELGARALDPLGISYYPETARYLDTLVLGGPIRYRNRPNLEGRFWHSEVRINSLGLREPEIAPQPAEDERRILAIGDSFVFGIGAEQDQTTVAFAERFLNARVTGKRFRVINMGCPSYNTEQEWIQFVETGRPLRPSGLLIFYSGNDIEDKSWVLDRRAGAVRDLAQRSYAASLMVTLARRALGNFGVGASLAVQVGSYVDGHPRWEAIAGALRSFAEAARAQGIPIVVLCLPEAPGLNEKVRAHCDKLGIPMVVLDPSADPRWRNAPRAKFANSSCDSHPNRHGSEVLGTLVGETIERLGWLAL